MSLAYYLPNWFFMYDLILELSFAVILFLVSLLAYRIYKLTYYKEVLLLAIGFSFIGLSNFIESLLNLLIIVKTENLVNFLNIFSFSLLNDLSVYSHISLRIIGLTILCFMTFKIDRFKVLSLMLITSLLVVFLSKDYIYSYYLVSTIYLLFITFHFLKAFLMKQKFNTLLIALAFVLLALDTFIFVLWPNHELSYVIGHFPELFAYLLILMNFLIVRKK